MMIQDIMIMIMIIMITMKVMLPIQDNGDVSDNGWAAATISAIFLPGLLGGNLIMIMTMK